MQFPNFKTFSFKYAGVCFYSINLIGYKLYSENIWPGFLYHFRVRLLPTKRKCTVHYNEKRGRSGSSRTVAIEEICLMKMHAVFLQKTTKKFRFLGKASFLTRVKTSAIKPLSQKCADILSATNLRAKRECAARERKKNLRSFPIRFAQQSSPTLL